MSQHLLLGLLAGLLEALGSLLAGTANGALVSEPESISDTLAPRTEDVLLANGAVSRERAADLLGLAADLAVRVELGADRAVRLSSVSSCPRLPLTKSQDGS